MKPTISVLIPALNEEDNIEPTVNEVLSAVNERFSSYEILILNDGSTDNTGTIADKLAANDQNIKVIHHKINMGLGYNYKNGVQLAKNDYVVLIPGDNQIPKIYMTKMFDLIGKADIIIPYMENLWVRSLPRRFISWCFTMLMNLLFGLNLNYYNGTVVHKKALVEPIPRYSNGFAYQAELLTKLVKSGHSYIEVAVPIRERSHGFSKAFYPKNIVSVLWAIGNLFWEIYFRGGETHHKPLRKIDVAK